MYMDEHVVDLKQQSMNLLLMHSNASKLTTEACSYKKSKKLFVMLVFEDVSLYILDYLFLLVTTFIAIPISQPFYGVMLVLIFYFTNYVFNY